MKIVVTGATGFIGSRMTAFLKKKGHIVKAIGRNSAKDHYRYRWFSKADSIENIDLLNISKFLSAIQGYDMVFHFAADMGGVGYFSQQQYTPFINNMRMDLNLVEASVKGGIKKIYYSASACAYPIDAQLKEGEPPKLAEHMLVPANSDQMYGWEKLMMILLSEHSPIDMRVGILNTVFGEGQEGVGARAKFPPSIVHKIIEAKKSKNPIEIWGNGKQTRTFLYIEDALGKMYEIMMKKNYKGPVNVASDEIVTVKQCADWLCEFAGIKPKYIFDTSKPSGVLARGIDNNKFYQMYRYKNRYTTKKGFQKLYSFMIKNGSF